MQINGADHEQRGHVLLIAGDPAVRRRTVQVEPSANLAALSIVPTPVLLGSDLPSDTTYLDAIKDQNALLMRLRAAAATPGPLLIYLSGRLTVDRRGRQLYLALNGSTPSTVRYTGLPWDWLGTELRHRPSGLTTVLLDVAADKGAWPLLQEYGTLPAATSAEVYGVVSPPDLAGTDGVSTYTRAWIEQLRRNPQRPSNSRLHALAAGHAALPPGAFLVPHTLELTGPAIATRQAAAQQDHDRPRPPKSNLQRLLAGDTSVLRRDQPAAQEPDEQSWQPEQPTPYGPAAAESYPLAPPSPVPSQPAATPPWQQHSPAPQYTAPSAQAQAPAPAAGPPTPGAPAHDERGRWVLPGHQQRPEPGEQPVRAPHPNTQQPTPQPYVPAQAPAPAPVQQPVQSAAPQQDPRPHLFSLAQAGKFNEAAQLAQMWEQHILQTHGIDSPEATQWVEIRADLAKQESKFLLATQLWIGAGRTRLAHQPPDAPEVLAVAQSAHYCWTQITDPRQARECGPELISLLRALPALDRRHLSMAQQRLEFLNNTPTGR